MNIQMAKITKETQKRRANKNTSSLVKCLSTENMINTTLINHFFGASKNLNKETFKKFMKNLQLEVIEFEFNEISGGDPFISEEDFAKVLLRFSNVNEYK